MRPPSANPTPNDSPPHAASDQAEWDELGLVLDRLSDAARSDRSPQEFYRLVAAQLTTLLAAAHTATWLRAGDGSLRVVTQTAGWADSIADRGSHEALIAAAIESSDVVSLAPGEQLRDAHNESPHHYLVAPVTLKDWVAGKSQPIAAIEVTLPAGRAPSSYQGAQHVLEAVSGVAAEFHLRQELNRLRADRGSCDALVEFAERVGGDTDLVRTAMAVANEGRRVVECDRLSVLTATRRRAKLVAVSGVDRVERRGRAARALEQMAALAVKLDEPIYYADGQADTLPQVDDVVNRYVDEFHARQLVMIPLPSPVQAEIKGTTRGVLVAEQFSGERGALDRNCIAEVSRVAAPALATAIAWHELPFASALQALGVLMLPRTMLRLLAVAVLVAAIATALLAISMPLTVDVRGQLLPTERQQVFAPRSGIVDQVMVKHADQVAAGETLLVLRDPELSVETERLVGEATKLDQQLEAIRATRSTAGRAIEDPLEMYQLSAEQEEVETQRENIARQSALLNEQTRALTVHCPLAGMITTWQVGERLAPGRPVERGQVLLSVADTTGAWELELTVPDEQLDMLREAGDEPLRVEYRLGSDAREMHVATVTRVAQRVDLVSTPTGEEVRQVLVTAIPDGDLPAELRESALRPGGLVRARIIVGDRPLGYVLFNDLWRTLRNWWEF